MKFWTAAAALALVVAYFLFSRRGGDTSKADAHRLVDSGALLLDVRTREEFTQGHIAGAVNIPVRELEGRLAELTPKERNVVVYCRSGHRSRAAERILKSAGFPRVHDLGAMHNW